MSLFAPQPNRMRWTLQPRELFLIVLFWTSLAGLSSVNRLLDRPESGFRVLSPAGPIAVSFIESWIWAAVTVLIFWLSSHFSVEQSRWLVRIPLLLLFGVVIAVGVYLAVDFARDLLVTIPRSRRGSTLSPWREVARFRFLNQFLIYLAILAAAFARKYFIRDQQRAREAVDLERRAATLEAQLSNARLDALRMQLNPHFLFNTLHAVSALVERDPGGVRRMIARLSELLRHTMDGGAPNEITLRNELSILQRYIEIMEIRFQGRLTVTMQIDDAALAALVPNLVLQPIVENALEHGAARASADGRIEIAARVAGDRLVLTVRDNGPGVASVAGTGVGLANTRARLVQLYGAEASLSLLSAPGGGAVSEIALPFHTSSDLRAEEIRHDA
jgi:two-component system, LytTR family, sensor kinase